MAKERRTSLVSKVTGMPVPCDLVCECPTDEVNSKRD